MAFGTPASSNAGADKALAESDVVLGVHDGGTMDRVLGVRKGWCENEVAWFRQRSGHAV